MSIKEIKEQSGLSVEVSTSLYWHCIWLRDAKPGDKNIVWRKLLWDKDYRLKRSK